MAKAIDIRKPKQVKSHSDAFPKVVATKNVGSTDDNYLVWSFCRIDRAGHFAFDCNRDDFNECDVLKKVVEYGGRKWKEIKQDTHDSKNKSKHHFLEYNELSDIAKERIAAKRLGEYTDSIYSLSLCNKIRIIGLRSDDRFEAIWFDPEHEFCPSDK